MNRARRRLCRAGVMALLLLAAAERAWADPIDLVNGGIFYSRENAAEFRAGDGAGLEVIGEFGNFSSEFWNPSHACFGCTPGVTINLSQSESFTNDSNEGGQAGGSVRIGNTDYWIDSMSFRIETGSVVIPDTSNDRNALVNAGRFLFRGMITGTSDAGVTRMFDLTGRGNASVFFGSNDWFSTNYSFAAPAAVPEPGTLLLFGSGAVAALLRRRKQQTGH